MPNPVRRLRWSAALLLLAIGFCSLLLGGCLGAVYGTFNRPYYQQDGLEHSPD